MDEKRWGGGIAQQQLRRKRWHVEIWSISVGPSERICDNHLSLPLQLKIINIWLWLLLNCHHPVAIIFEAGIYGLLSFGNKKAVILSEM